MNTNFAAVMGALAAWALTAASCKPDSSHPSVPAPTAAGAAREAGAASAGPVRIAMIGKSSTNPVFLSARAGAEVAAKDLSGKVSRPVEVVWLTPPQEDAQIQAQRIAQAVSEGASASCCRARTPPGSQPPSTTPSGVACRS